MHQGHLEKSVEARQQARCGSATLFLLIESLMHVRIDLQLPGTWLAVPDLGSRLWMDLGQRCHWSVMLHTPPPPPLLCAIRVPSTQHQKPQQGCRPASFHHLLGPGPYRSSKQGRV